MSLLNRNRRKQWRRQTTASGTLRRSDFTPKQLDETLICFLTPRRVCRLPVEFGQTHASVTLVARAPPPGYRCGKRYRTTEQARRNWLLAECAENGSVFPTLRGGLSIHTNALPASPLHLICQKMAHKLQS